MKKQEERRVFLDLKEQLIQKRLIEKLTKDGMYVVKLLKTTKNGIPDVMAIDKSGKVKMYEVKKPSGATSALQRFVASELKKYNVEVFVVNDYKNGALSVHDMEDIAKEVEKKIAEKRAEEEYCPPF